MHYHIDVLTDWMVIPGTVNTEGFWHCIFEEKYKIYT